MPSSPLSLRDNFLSQSLSDLEERHRLARLSIHPSRVLRGTPAAVSILSLLRHFNRKVRPSPASRLLPSFSFCAKGNQADRFNLISALVPRAQVPGEVSLCLSAALATYWLRRPRLRKRRLWPHRIAALAGKLGRENCSEIFFHKPKP